ncbi:MAG: styrene monooxygenase/indole monooxygenase family protein [Myxococcota bacterium]
MRAAVIGSGQAGLVLAHGLLAEGHAVDLYSDRTAQGWLEDGRPTGTAVRFGTSLAWERALGLDDAHAEAPRMEGLRATICSHPGKELLRLCGRFPESPLAIDLRLQSARWMDKLAARGGRIEVGVVDDDGVDQIAAAHDVTFVATGKEGGRWFTRDAARSPAEAPLRHLAMANCEGPPMAFADVPYLAAKFNILEGAGECYWTPYWHQSGKALWNLVFEAKPGGPLDVFGGCTSGDEVLAACARVVDQWLPWDAAWLRGARLADPRSWLVGAVTPTVRDPVGRTRSGHRILPVGDAYCAFDPLGAQGANTGNRLARELVHALRGLDGAPVDDAWVRRTYDTFWDRWAGPSMRWTHLLLAPMGPAARYFFVSQRGSDGTTLGGDPRQRLADAFVGAFDDPSKLVDTLSGLGSTRGFVQRELGRGADVSAFTGLVSVLGRQVANALSV